MNSRNAIFADSEMRIAPVFLSSCSIAARENLGIAMVFAILCFIRTLSLRYLILALQNFAIRAFLVSRSKSFPGNSRNL